MPKIRSFSLLLLSTLSTYASAVSIYQNDFTVMPGAEWSNSSISTANGESFLATTPDGSTAGTRTLSLSSIPAHTSLTLNFDLYVIKSWDGEGFKVSIDGTDVLFATFSNTSATQSYPNNIPPLGPGGSFAARTGAFQTNHLGYGASGFFGDTTYRFSLSLNHVAPSTVVSFTSFLDEALPNEGWGIDNIDVSVNPVPEPLSVVGMLVGLTLAAKRRKRGSHA